MFRVCLIAALALVAACSPRPKPAVVTAPTVFSPAITLRENPIDSPGEGYELIGGNYSTTIFIHRPTTEKRGQQARAWFVMNIVSGIPETGSIRIQNEFDCRQRQYRAITSFHYARMGANGPVLKQYPYVRDQPWQPVPPAAQVEQMMNAACTGSRF